MKRHFIACCMIGLCAGALAACNDFENPAVPYDEAPETPETLTPPAIDPSWNLVMMPDEGGQAPCVFVYKDKKYDALFTRTLGWNGGDGVLTASATADVFDYQQWKTGKRLEGFITQFGGMLVTAVGMVTSLILPYFYRYYGLGTDYNVLYNADVRTPIFNVMIITTIISCLLTVIPMLFYDMSEKRQQQIVEDLKARAAAENAQESEESAENETL